MLRKCHLTTQGKLKDWSFYAILLKTYVFIIEDIYETAYEFNLIRI